MITFIFKSSLSLLLLFGLYWFLLKKEKLLIFNRFFLILAIVFSLIIPFISIPVNFQTTLKPEKIITAFDNNIPNINPIQNTLKQDLNQSFTEVQPSKISISIILTILYITGVVFFLFRFLKNIYFIFRQIRLSEKIKYEGYRIVLIDNETNPYCFFNTIFLCKRDYLNGNIDKNLLSHELEHIRQSHSVDILFIEFIMIFYWFNPILLLFNRAIRVNHEYLADNGVIQDYFDIKGYSEKLLSFIICNNIPLTSGFNHSLTKMRLMMMTKSKSSTISSNLRILVIISLMSAFFFILSCKSSKPQLVKMSFIPAGTYVGQAIGYFDSSRFVSISLEAFLMSNEITNRQFREFINWAKKNPDDSIYPVKFELGTITDNKTGKKEDTWLRKVTPICISRILNELIDQDALTKLDSKYKNYFTDKKYDDYPVVGVSKKAAEYYCIWKTDKENALRKESGLPPNHAYRLPLEQEWNYVAKQPLENINSNNKTLLQKSSEGIANSLGLTHFDDNVSEWVASSTRETNGIVRGGSWKTNNNISDRKVCDPNYKDGTVGFRIVQSYSSPMPSVLNNSIKPHTVEVIQDTTGINQSSLMSDTNSILTDQSSLNTFDTIYKKVKIEHADIITGNANSKDVTVIIGNAIVTYGNIEIKADSIVLNRRTNQLFAAGRLNKSGKIIGSPVFKEGTKEIKANEITYNFITNRGRFKGIFYKENNINNNRSYIKKDSSSIISSNEKPKLFPIKKGEYSQLPYKYQEKRINPINKKDTIIHYGIDIKANSGTVVMATAGGKVIKASWDDKGLGNLIVIDHGEGYQSWYGHLGDFSVQNGASVIKGQTIGHVGSSGVSTEPHLHFEIRLNGKNVDPMTYLK